MQGNNGSTVDTFQMQNGLNNGVFIDLAERSKELEKASKPLLDFIHKYGCPHSYIIVTESGVELLSGECVVPFEPRD